MSMKLADRLFCGLMIVVAAACQWASADNPLTPGARTLLDAHNCYPYQGRWADRIERALSTGMPLALEPDLDWVDGKSIVSHGKPYTGEEPTLEEYFLSRVAPDLRNALASGNRDAWPLVVLNIDFKDSSPEHCKAVREVLRNYQDILTTATKTDNIEAASPFTIRPMLLLASGGGAQFDVFYNDVAIGDEVFLFGAAQTHSNVPDGLSGAERAEFVASVPPEQIVPKPADNFRRWWNNPWSVVEAGGQPRAGDWTAADDARLRALVDHAHVMGFFIRFYTLNGHVPGETQGWSTGYNFGSRESVELRWSAAISAGVDFVATDMYEAFAEAKR